MDHVSNLSWTDEDYVRLECLAPCGPVDPSGYHTPVEVARWRDSATIEQVASAWTQHLLEAVDPDSDRRGAIEGIHAALAAIPLPANCSPEGTRQLLLEVVRMYGKAAGQ